MTPHEGIPGAPIARGMEPPMPDVRGRIDEPQLVERPNAAVFGRILGNSVLELTFRCPRDAEVFVGDLLIAEGERGDAGSADGDAPLDGSADPSAPRAMRASAPPLLFRITDIRYGLE